MFIWRISLMACLLTSVLASQAQSDKLVSFSLKDQFDRSYSDTQYKGKALILVGGDRVGSRYVQPWAHAIYDVMEKDIALSRAHLVGFADLRAVPGFLRGFVKGKFPKDEREWVLLDWKGGLTKSYDGKTKTCNILIFNPEGDLIYKGFVAEFKEEEFRKIEEKLQQLMAVK